MPSSAVCCVPNCNVTREDNIPLHSFPNPEKDPDRFRTWLYAVGGELLNLHNRFVYKYRKVCHKHFESKYHTWTRTLSVNAVPTLLLPEPPLQASQFSWHKLTEDIESPKEESQFSWQNETIDEKADAVADVKCRSEAQLVPDIAEPATCSQGQFSCNVCRKSIIGFRFACVQCADWDLCGACEARGEHAAHYVLRVPAHKTHRETQQVLSWVRRALAEGGSGGPADISGVKQEIETEELPAYEPEIDDDAFEIHEEYLETDSTDGTDSFVLPTSPPKRTSARSKSKDIEIVSPTKRKRVKYAGRSKSTLTPTEPLKKIKLASVPLKKLKLVPESTIKTSALPWTEVKKESSQIVATDRAKKIVAIPQVSLKQLKPINRSALPLNLRQKGSSQILSVVPPNLKIAPNTFIRKVSLEELKVITDRFKKRPPVTSIEERKESSRSNTDEGTLLDEVSGKMKCLGEMSQSIKKETVKVTVSDDTISNTVPQSSSNEIESSNAQKMGSTAGAISDKLTVKLPEARRKSSRYSLKNIQRPSKGKS